MFSFRIIAIMGFILVSRAFTDWSNKN